MGHFVPDAYFRGFCGSFCHGALYHAPDCYVVNNIVYEYLIIYFKEVIVLEYIVLMILYKSQAYFLI